jgi:predicted ATPase
MATRKAPARSRKAKRTVAVVGALAILGTTLELASGGVTLAERALALVVKGQQVLAGEASAATPRTCESPRKSLPWSSRP